MNYTAVQVCRVDQAKIIEISNGGMILFSLKLESDDKKHDHTNFPTL